MESKKSTSKEKEIFKVHDEVKKELKKIPGVVTVGIGLKEVKGELTQQVVFKVYVKKKKPLSEIESENVIPIEIMGYKTDVLRYFESGKTSTGGTRPLIGGIPISSVLNDSGLLRRKPGTLSCIVKKAGTTDKRLLSCEHVFDHTGASWPSASPANKVYQPKYSTCLGFVCNEVGETENGIIGNVTFNNGTLNEEFYIDCAIGNINEGIGTSNTIKEIGSISGSRDISTLAISASASYQVKKMGSTTKLTTGIIDDIAFDEIVDPPGINEMRRISIRPNPGRAWSDTFQVRPEDKTDTIALFNDTNVTVTDLGDNKLKFETNVFVLPGDSGSALVNSSNEIVGLVYAALKMTIRVLKNGTLDSADIPLGKGIACHIGPVLEQLDIEIPAGTSPSSGMPLLTPGTPIKTEFSDDDISLNEALINLEGELHNSVNGAMLVSLLDEHLPEIINLVHHRRPVKFIWHKYKGPAFLNDIINAARYREKSFRKEIDGITRYSLIDMMHEVLKKEGSQKLNHAMERISDFVYRLLKCNTMNEIMNRIKYEVIC